MGGMLARITLGLSLVALLGCSGSSDIAPGALGDFYVVEANVASGSIWKINRPIEITFSKDVDFTTVNQSTIRIADQTGFSATGVFYQPTHPQTGLLNRKKVVFQPNCPALEDASDAGLVPFRKYKLIVPSDSAGYTVRSTSADTLDSGLVREFMTPESFDPFELFQDTVAGPPRVLILATRPTPGEPIDPDTPATFVEIGGVQRFFGRDPVTLEGRLEAGLDLPLSHYSLPENQVSFVVQFDQSVLATAANLAHLRIEYEGATGWERISSVVELDRNCTEDGARVRVTPRGILPQNKTLRVVVADGFEDLAGDPSNAVNQTFAVAETLSGGDPNPLFPSVDNPEVDEVLESFDLVDFEDQTAVFPVPTAKWGDGGLEANFAFGGTGGPGGDFDWHIAPGTELVLDTNSDVIFGGPGGAETTSQPIVHGVVDVRNLFLPSSSVLRIVGPNTCTILASGNVRIQGKLFLSGSANPGVATLNTANQPENGAAGAAGGGDGGTGSYFTTQSTPRGGRGFGAFQKINFGGEGGETSYLDNNSPSQRRGAGGGGGTLGSDVFYDHDGLGNTDLVHCQELIGLDGEYGNSGTDGALGAESGTERAQGGLSAPDPFLDNDPNNNFLGTMRTTEGVLIKGELEEVWAGSGGGGGGDSVNHSSFPHPNFGPMGDEKGAGGGGAAGGLQILAIGAITVGTPTLQGFIVAEGGHGGGGENGMQRYGGGSGAGSGGHIILSSANEIVVHGVAPGGGPWYQDNNQSGHKPRSISAVGGEGGAGNFNRGGASFSTVLPWLCDRIPMERLAYPDVPPIQEVCFKALPDFSDPEGPCTAAGGDGSPGIIQFHVEDLADLRFPEVELLTGLTYDTGLDVTYVSAPPPLGWKSPGEIPNQMVPFFGRLSMTRSQWIPLGLARVDAGGGTDQVNLHGVAGPVPHAAGEIVDHEDPVVGPEVIANANLTVQLDASGIDPGDVRYRDNPALLRRATLLLVDSADSGNFRHFRIASAEYDGGGDAFLLYIDPDGPNPATFSAAGNIEASLIPRSVRIMTAGIDDSYPDDTSVILEYDATKVDPFSGQPSDTLSFSATHGNVLTQDLSDLNSDDWDFVRFQVIFDLDKNGAGVNPTAPRPGLDHLRLQFDF